MVLTKEAVVGSWGQVVLFVVHVENIEEMCQRTTMFLLFREHKRK
jgi:hypothetical protein